MWESVNTLWAVLGLFSILAVCGWSVTLGGYRQAKQAERDYKRMEGAKVDHEHHTYVRRYPS